MTDLETVRGRVEQAEARLKGVAASRERESASLVEMWQQLRSRFTAQEEEIARARSRAAALETENQELLGMVTALVETIEGNVKTLPDGAAPAPAPAAADAPTAAPEPEPVALQRDPTLAETDIEALLVEGTDAAPAAAPEPVVEDSAALPAEPDPPAGIKTLMSRVQRAMHRPPDDRRDAAPTAAVADLLDADTHDDEEAIKALRRELDGLKSRVAASTRRH
jgi:hypothetical protein